MPSNHRPEVEAFLQSLQFEKKYSQHTLAAYRTDLSQFFDYLHTGYESPPLASIQTSFVRSWLADLKGENDLTNKSLNRKISTLKSFFKYLLKHGVIEKSPMYGIVSPKIARRLPQFVDEKDIEKLRNLSFPDTHEGRTDKLILTMLYTTGMRLSELINLKESGVDYSYGHIKVLGKGNKERIIPAASDLLKSVRDYVAQKPVAKEKIENVFTNEKGKPFNPKTIYNSVHKYLSYITDIEKKSPHVLRHTFATHLMNNGAEMNAVKELLGHASLASTQVYTHLTIEKLKEIYKQAHPKG